MKTVGIMLLTLIIILGSFYAYASRKISPVVIERTFNAPVEKLWSTWSEVDSIKKWWGPKNYTAPIIQSDFRVAASYLFAMKSSKGDVSWITGKYKEITPFKKIISTVSFSDDAGNTISPSQAGVLGQWAYETILTVEFESINGKTKITVTETGIPLIMSVFAKMGWEQQFDKIETLL